MELSKSRMVEEEDDDDFAFVDAEFKTEIGLLMTSIGRRIFASAAKIAFSIEASVNVEMEVVVVEPAIGEEFSVVL